MFMKTTQLVLHYAPTNFHKGKEILCKCIVYRKPPKITRHFNSTSEDSKFKDIQCHCRRAGIRIGLLFDPWHWLYKLGFKKCKIIRFRRKLRRFHYPWMFFGLPTGFTMMLGDFLSQICWEKGDKDKYNIKRTLLLGAIGFFLVAPLTSKWTLFWMRRLPRHNRPGFIARSLVLDIIFLTPFMLLVTMAAFDYKVTKEKWQDPEQLYKKRYKNSLQELMQFYVQTRPILSIISCFILTRNMAKWVRTMYYIYFYSLMSKSFSQNKLGEKYKPIKVQGKAKLQEQCDCVKKFFKDHLPKK